MATALKDLARPRLSLRRPRAIELPQRPKLHVVREPDVRLTWAEIARDGLPRPGLSAEVNAWRARNARNLLRGVRRVMAAHALGLPTMYGRLWLTVQRASGEEIFYGLASARVTTTAGVGFITDAFQNLVELENMKYHGIGTGTNAENVTDTALQTELTTQLNPDSTRATGTATEPSANVYRSTATNTVDASVAITEHGIFSQAATGGGVLLDRSVFAAINLASGDSLTTQFDHTQTAGS